MNILLITTDSHRYDYMGFCGAAAVNTPNMDKLAREGAVHTTAYTANPLCMPARCSVLTGLYSHQHCIINNSGDLNPLLNTLPQALRANGYSTAMIGKIHFYEGITDNLEYTKCYGELEKLGFDHSWVTAGKSMSEFTEDEWTAILRKKGLLDDYRQNLRDRAANVNDCNTASSMLDEEDTVDYRTAQAAIDYLQGYKDEKPFFAWVSFCNPHFPYDPDEKYHAKYKGKTFPDPRGVEPNESQKRHAVAYAAMTEQLDTYLGSVLAALEETGKADDTLIIFTSDHGDMLGDHGFYSKIVPYEGSTRIPFIAWHKKLIQPCIVTQPTELTDTAATFLEAAGITDVQAWLPESPSQSLWKMWRGETLARKYAFTENGYQFQRPFMQLCDGKYKYVYYSFDSDELLFDLEADPHELENIAAAQPALVAEFRHLLLRRIGSTPPPSPTFWVKEKTTGLKGPGTHHGPGRTNTGLDNLI